LLDVLACFEGTIKDHSDKIPHFRILYCSSPFSWYLFVMKTKRATDIPANPQHQATDAAAHYARRASTGKIARLPAELREELNRGLADGEDGATIAN
jgi:hypothetical protein